MKDNEREGRRRKNERWGGRGRGTKDTVEFVMRTPNFIIYIK